MSKAGRFAVLLALAAASCSTPQPPRRLLACADPNNLPFSNRAGQGFENKLAEMIAADLHAELGYVWWAQRRGYVRNTLNEKKCDFWPGVASNVEMVATSRPYYRSTYVFVTREGDRLAGLTLDDPRLRKLRIGVQMVGNDAMNTPPAHALASRGIVGNIRGYMLYGDYEKPDPPAEIVRAVARGEVDVALVWGPLAGFFAKSSPTRLRLEPVTPWLDRAQWPMQYDISVGVQKNDAQLLKEVDGVLAARAGRIKALLASYGVPVVQP
ncbi:MAG TPA: quinoprotein dehydrogenase-associated putative ABC transporter substrate-binding protein [Allosphingosinicella sp.]|jgi:mxaJ protein